MFAIMLKYPKILWYFINIIGNEVFPYNIVHYSSAFYFNRITKKTFWTKISHALFAVFGLILFIILIYIISYIELISFVALEKINFRLRKNNFQQSNVDFQQILFELFFG